jgi:hypothetical protein
MTKDDDFHLRLKIARSGRGKLKAWDLFCESREIPLNARLFGGYKKLFSVDRYPDSSS